MCLPNYIKTKLIDIDNPVIGYRNWRLRILLPTNLISLHQEYIWDTVIEGPHEVANSNSGIYSYNNNYYNNYNYYNNNNNYNNNYYNNYNYNNNYNYYVSGIIHQYGNTAIHQNGFRSEYAKIVTLFTIRESDAKGPGDFLGWIKKFNSIIQNLASKYESDTIHWQDLSVR